MARAWIALALFAVGFLLFLLAPLVVLGAAAVIYAGISYRRGRGTKARAPQPTPIALPSASAGFGAGVR